MKVFYSDKQSTDKNKPSLINGKYYSSPSAGKPALVVKDWQDKNFPVEVISNFKPVTKDFFCLAHNKTYVDEVLSGVQNNGFINTIPEVNETLFWTNGSLFAAAIEALESKTNTCSPTSGFHHAGYNGFKEFGYFCTFNGLIATALSLLEKKSQSISIFN